MVEGIYRLLMSDYHLPVNLGNPDEITIKDFADEIVRLTETTQKIVYMPLPKDDPRVRQPDTTRAREILGWEAKVPRSVGVKITYEYFKALPKEDLYQRDHKSFDKYIH
jgi:dTDP-glucose 4,6-dehydratase